MQERESPLIRALTQLGSSKMRVAVDQIREASFNPLARFPSMLPSRLVATLCTPIFAEWRLLILDCLLAFGPALAPRT